MEVADNFALSTFNIIQDGVFLFCFFYHNEVLNNQSHMADMKQKDLYQQALTVIFIK